MYFYLDKELAKQNIARCLWKSEHPATEEELNLVRKHFNYNGEFLVYEGDDIPYPIKYNSLLDTIEQEVAEEPVQAISEEDSVEEKEIFGEEDGETYWYINKEKAINKGLAENYMTSDKPLLNPQEYFGTDNVLCYVGNELPYYVTYLPEINSVREATDFEKYKRKQYELKENEVVLENKEEIITIEDGQYVNEKEEVITIPRLEEAIKQEWDKENHVWVDITTDLDRVEAQYREYEGMDTVSVVEEMKLEDEAMAEEFINMLIELRGLIYTLKSQEIKSFKTKMTLPEPSEKLLNFKNKFKLTK